MDIETLKEWLPLWENFGTILTDVPEESVPEIIKIFAEHDMKCEVTKVGNGFCLIHVKGKGKA